MANSFIRAIDKLQLTNNDMACVSGIGCSSWAPVYLNFDCLHSLHGRALAQAEGLKAVNPDKTIVVFTATATAPALAATILSMRPSATWT